MLLNFLWAVCFRVKSILSPRPFRHLPLPLSLSYLSSCFTTVPYQPRRITVLTSTPTPVFSFPIAPLSLSFSPFVLGSRSLSLSTLFCNFVYKWKGRELRLCTPGTGYASANVPVPWLPRVPSRYTLKSGRRRLCCFLMSLSSTDSQHSEPSNLDKRRARRASAPVIRWNYSSAAAGTSRRAQPHAGYRKFCLYTLYIFLSRRVLPVLLILNI